MEEMLPTANTHEECSFTVGPSPRFKSHLILSTYSCCSSLELALVCSMRSVGSGFDQPENRRRGMGRGSDVGTAAGTRDAWKSVRHEQMAGQSPVLKASTWSVRNNCEASF